MDLTTLRQVAKGDYGRGENTTADPVFTDAVLNTRINRAHRRLAYECKLYRRTFTVDLPIASAGLSVITLNASVYEVDPSTVVVLNGATWQAVRPSDERTIRQLYGPPDEVAAGIPSRFWCEESSDGGTVASAAGTNRQLVLWPGATAAVTNGCKFDAWVYPADLTADGHIPPFPVSEHDHLIPLICHEMAKLDYTQGRADPALVSLWAETERISIAQLRRKMQRSRNPGPREVRLRYCDSDI